MPKCRFCDENVSLLAKQCPNCGAPVDGLSAHEVEELEQHVRALLEQGQKLQAIRFYKDRTEASLEEAK
jgi:ribosomal protein L7/L12